MPRRRRHEGPVRRGHAARRPGARRAPSGRHRRRVHLRNPGHRPRPRRAGARTPRRPRRRPRTRTLHAPVAERVRGAAGTGGAARGRRRLAGRPDRPAPRGPGPDPRRLLARPVQQPRQRRRLPLHGGRTPRAARPPRRTGVQRRHRRTQRGTHRPAAPPLAAAEGDRRRLRRLRHLRPACPPPPDAGTGQQHPSAERRPPRLRRGPLGGAGRSGRRLPQTRPHQLRQRRLEHRSRGAGLRLGRPRRDGRGRRDGLPRRTAPLPRHRLRRRLLPRARSRPGRTRRPPRGDRPPVRDRGHRLDPLPHRRRPAHLPRPHPRTSAPHPLTSPRPPVPSPSAVSMPSPASVPAPARGGLA